MKLVDGNPNHSPLLVEAGSADGIFCVRTRSLCQLGKLIFQPFRLSAAVWLASIFMVWHAGSAMGQTLSPPTISSPGSTSAPGTPLTTLTPTFYWTGVTGASRYGLYISQYPYGSGNIIYSTAYASGTSLTIPAGYLQNGVEYRWNMTSFNSSGVEGTPCSPLYFQAPAAALGPPTISSPGSTSAPGTPLTTLTPTFYWTGVTGASRYGLYISQYPYGSGNIIYSTAYASGTSLTIPAGYLQNGVEYRWNMTSFNSSGVEGTPCSPLYFQAPAAALGPPSITSPGSTSAPGTTLTTLTPTFYWTGVTGASRYGLYISQYPYGSGNIIYSTAYASGTSLTIPAGYLQNGVEYRWNMTSFNSSGVEGTPCSPLYFQAPAAAQPPTHDIASQIRADTGVFMPDPNGVLPQGVGVYFQVTPTDPQGNTVRMEVEWHQLPATFTGTANLFSPYVSSGSHAATATLTGLAVGNYGWAYRVVDSQGLASPWTSPSSPYDFTVQAAAQPPTHDIASQIRADTGVFMPDPNGVLPQGVGVYFQVTPTDPQGNTVRMEVEWHQLPATFTGTANLFSPYVSSGSHAATATLTGLAVGNYGWAYRVVDSQGLASPWTSPSSPYDFTVQAAAQPPTHDIASQIRADTGVFMPDPNGVLPQGVGVYFQVTPTDPQGNTVRMEVEWHQLPATFTGTANLFSPYVSSGSHAATATLTGLAVGNYGWAYRVVDGQGLASPWTSPSSPYDFTVQAATQPTISIISPTSTTTWTAGTSQNITWTVSGPSSQINYYVLDYSLDGVTWTYNFLNAYPPSTSVSWAIPANIASTHAIIRLKAYNSSAVQVAANVSPAFTISSSAGTPTSIPTCNNRSPSPASAVTITFNGTASTGSSPSCGIASYLWTFGDGTPSGTGPTPAHTYYPSPGSVTTYNVYLQVTDSCGKIAANAQPLTITITGQALGNNNPTQPTSKDPVNLATGNYTYNHVDLQIPGRGLPFEFQRYYNSKATASTGLPLGYGWTDSYNIGLTVSPSNNAVVIAFGDGHSEMYATNGAGGYFSQPGIYNVLTAGGGSYTLTTKEQQKYNFNPSGQLTSIVDKNNNAITLAYTGNNLTSITNTVERVISFAYNANNCLTNITDPLGRTVRFAYDANTNLISVTDTRDGLTQFSYDQYHQITNAIDPRGNTFVSMQYDDEQRVVSYQKDALQGTTAFIYDFVHNQTTVTDAMDNVSLYIYDDQLRVKSIRDNLGNVESFQYDTNNNRIQVIDKNGKSTAYAYDANGNVISKTDPFTSTTTIAYDALNNPTNRLDAQNGLTIFKYDPKGNLTNTFNSLSKTNTYQYDAFAEPVVVTDANGNSTTNTYDPFGNLILSRDAFGETNAFAYDTGNRKIKRVDALGLTNLFIYDNADNLTASVNALGKTNYFSFDGNNNRVTATDFSGYTTTSIYDPKDRLIIVRDPLGRFHHQRLRRAGSQNPRP